MYAIVTPHSNHCQGNNTERSCLESATQHPDSHCAWELSSHTCHFSQPSVSFSLIVIITCVSAAVGVPFARMLEYVVIKFAVPIEPVAVTKSKSAEAGTSLARSWKRFLFNRSSSRNKALVAPSVEMPVVEPTTPHDMRMAAMEVEEDDDDFVPVNANHDRCISIIGRQSLEVEMDSLQRQLKGHIDSLHLLDTTKDRSRRTNLLRKNFVLLQLEYIAFHNNTSFTFLFNFNFQMRGLWITIVSTIVRRTWERRILPGPRWRIGWIYWWVRA